MVATVVVFSGFALGSALNRRVINVGNVLWAVGGLGTLVFGIWLAIYVKGYDLLDGWIIAAIVLWAVANEFGRRAQVGFMAAAPGGRDSAVTALPSQATLMHWLRSAVVVALLVVMIYKPGA